MGSEVKMETDMDKTDSKLASRDERENAEKDRDKDRDRHRHKDRHRNKESDREHKREKEKHRDRDKREKDREIKTGTENTVKDQGIPRVAVCGAMLYAELEVESLVAHVLLFCRITIYLSKSFAFQIVLG